MQGGLSIDLSKMNSVVVDSDAAQLTIGPGVHFRDIFGPVYEAGFEIRESLSKSSFEACN